MGEGGSSFAHGGLVTTLLLDEAFVSLLRTVCALWRVEAENSEGSSAMNRVEIDVGGGLILLTTVPASSPDGR